jgi:hypothetical protein
MADDLRFDLEWLARDYGSPAERASFAAVRITVGGVVLTEVYDTVARTMRSEARLSVVHLGRWLAANWWRLRHEPEEASAVDWRLAHELGAAGGGFLWPPLTLSGDGETLTLRSAPPQSAASDDELIRYVRTCEVTVGVPAFEEGVDRLMESLLARLEALGAADEELREVWETLDAERHHEQAGRLRRREAMLGLDPEAVPSESVEALARTGDWMGEGALEEVLMAARYATIHERLRQLSLWSMADGLVLDASALETIGKPWIPPARLPARPWERGNGLAGHTRAALGLAADDPLGTALLSGLLAADVLAPANGATQAGPERMSAGFRRAGGEAQVRAVLRARHPRARRFEVARLMAEAMLAPADDRVLPITDARTARQKAQRAFAQELLCPVEGLVARLTLPAPHEAEIEAAADHYEVSEWVVVSALVNRGLVPREYLGRLSG